MNFSLKTLNLKIFLFLCLHYNCQYCDGLRVLGIFPFNSYSHFLMSAKLLQNLANKGHQVDVYSHFPLKKSLPNYTDYSLIGTIPDLINNMTYKDILFYRNDMIYYMDKMFEVCGLSSCKLLEIPVFQKLIHNPPQDPPYDVMIVEISFALCHAAWSRHLKIPMIDVWPNVLPAWLFDVHGETVTSVIIPNEMYSYKDPNTFLNRLNNWFFFAATDQLFKYYAKEQDQIIEKYFGPGYPTSTELLKDAGLLFINYHSSIQGIRSFAPSVVPIFGIHIEEKNETLPVDLQKWLDDSKHGFIYFTFGSMFLIESLPESIIKAMYEAFESVAPVRVLWKIKNPEELPSNLPKTVKTQKWFPQQAILKHKNIKAFVTHGGLMGTMESIYFAVPMVVVPLFSDQLSNAIIYERKKIAVQVNFEQIETKLKDSLHEILNNPIYKQNIKKTSEEYRDWPLSLLDTATRSVEYVARYGNKALRSPIVDMPWWQVHHLDIYVFFSTAIAFLLYVAIKLLKMLLCLIVSKNYNHQTEKIKSN